MRIGRNPILYLLIGLLLLGSWPAVAAVAPMPHAAAHADMTHPARAVHEHGPAHSQSADHGAGADIPDGGWCPHSGEDGCGQCVQCHPSAVFGITLVPELRAAAYPSVVGAVEQQTNSPAFRPPIALQI